MKKNERVYLAIFLASFAFVVWVNANLEQDDWKVTFQQHDAGAYGSEVLYKVLPYLFENNRITSVDIPPYEVVSDTTITGTNYIFVTQSFQPDDAETYALLRHVARGNAIFVAAQDFGVLLQAVLGFDTSSKFGAASPVDSTGIRMADSTHINLLNPLVATEKGYFYNTDLIKSVLSIQDDTLSETTEVDEGMLGLLEDYPMTYTWLGAFENGGYNFLKIDFGHGFFLLNSTPLAFTNYNMLIDENADYTYGALSYLPVRPSFWDEYYKPNKLVQFTPLRFILSSPALKTAYYLLLGAIVLFMVVRSRRKQRTIPILIPKQNTTVEFAHTIGRLYHQQGDHRNLAQKMLDQFIHYVQRQLNLPCTGLEGLSLERVSARTGLEFGNISGLISLLKQVNEQAKLDAHFLRELTIALDKFYASSKR